MRQVLLPVAVSMWMLSVGACAQVHGKQGITLPAPPAVEKHPVVDVYNQTNGTDVKSRTTIDGLKMRKVQRRAPISRLRMHTRSSI